MILMVLRIKFRDTEKVLCTLDKNFKDDIFRYIGLTYGKHFFLKEKNRGLLEKMEEDFKNLYDEKTDEISYDYITFKLEYIETFDVKNDFYKEEFDLTKVTKEQAFRPSSPIKLSHYIT